MQRIALTVAGLALVALTGCAGTEREPSHPNYAAAIADLRVARVILDRESEYTAERDQYKALEAIDRAVLDLKNASIDSGQALEPAPVLDPTLDYRGRLGRARELLLAADHELSFREDTMEVRPSRDSARRYVDDAQDAVSRVMRERREARGR
jgi:hypothetical protein